VKEEPEEDEEDEDEEPEDHNEEHKGGNNQNKGGSSRAGRMAARNQGLKEEHQTSPAKK
jgi:hypothetical protein